MLDEFIMQKISEEFCDGVEDPDQIAEIIVECYLDDIHILIRQMAEDYVAEEIV